MTGATLGAVWQREDVAAGFIDDRRKLIPLFDVQEQLARSLITRGGRSIRRFCDLGAGDGGFAELVMDSHPESTGVLVDFSPPMVAAAEARLADRGSRWAIVEADLSTSAWLDQLPADEHYDAVVSRLCIHHLPDERKRRLYEEIYSLLAPGGLFLNWEHVATGGLAEGLFSEYFVQRLLEAEQDRDNPRTREEVLRSYNDAHDDDILCDPETQCAWLREIGFDKVDVYFKLPELAIFGGERNGGGDGTG
jgi:tRNA (cmo5U34)-methyltransferase